MDVRTLEFGIAASFDTPLPPPPLPLPTLRLQTERTKLYRLHILIHRQLLPKQIIEYAEYILNMLAEIRLRHAFQVNRFHRRDRHPVLATAEREVMNRPISLVAKESHQHLRRTLKPKESNIEFLYPPGSVTPVLKAFFSLSNSFSMT